MRLKKLFPRSPAPLPSLSPSAAAIAGFLALLAMTSLSYAIGRPLRLQKCVFYAKPVVGPPIGGHALLVFPNRPSRPDRLAAQLKAWQRQYDDPQDLELLGFAWRRSPMIVWPMQLGSIEKRGECYELQLPWWIVPLIGGGILLLWLRRQVAPRVGMCAACGYDLRATPMRCPECGAVPERDGPRPSISGTSCC
jgi:hypothetical protein